MFRVNHTIFHHENNHADFQVCQGETFSEEHLKKSQEMIKKSGQMSVPVIIVDGEIVVGFNQSRLDSLLS